jgi:hypothetical protein
MSARRFARMRSACECGGRCERPIGLLVPSARRDRSMLGTSCRRVFDATGRRAFCCGSAGRVCRRKLGRVSRPKRPVADCGPPMLPAVAGRLERPRPSVCAVRAVESRTAAPPLVRAVSEMDCPDCAIEGRDAVGRVGIVRFCAAAAARSNSCWRLSNARRSLPRNADDCPRLPTFDGGTATATEPNAQTLSARATRDLWKDILSSRWGMALEGLAKRERSGIMLDREIGSMPIPDTIGYATWRI